MKDIPIYTDSIETAHNSNELNEYRESLTVNLYCKDAIQNSISENFDGMHLKSGAEKQVIDEFGFDRVLFMLANTLQQKDFDGRFSRDNKEWAKTIFIPDDRNRAGFVIESHPAVLDGFIDLVRQAYRELNLFDNSHCIPATGLDFENKILVLNPFGIKDEYKKPEYQLFYAQSGFGCSPSARGRKVFGTFLYDGERTNFDRSRFFGTLKPELIPEWAKEKVKELQKPSIKNQLEKMKAEQPAPSRENKNKDKGAR